MLGESRCRTRSKWSLGFKYILKLFLTLSFARNHFPTLFNNIISLFISKCNNWVQRFSDTFNLCFQNNKGFLTKRLRVIFVHFIIKRVEYQSLKDRGRTFENVLVSLLPIFFLIPVLHKGYEPDVRVTRGCGWIRHHKDCYKADNEDHLETVCQCFSEGCNGAVATTISLVVLAIAVVVSMVWFRWINKRFTVFYVLQLIFYLSYL